MTAIANTLARPWSPAEDRAVRARYLADGPTLLSRELARSWAAVAHRARRLGVRRRRPWTSDDDEALRLLWNTAPLAEIAKKIDRTKDATYLRATQVLRVTSGATQGMELLTHAAERTGFATGQLRRVLAASHVHLTHVTTHERPRASRKKYWLLDTYDVDAAVAVWMKGEPVSSAARRHGLDDDRARGLLRLALAAGVEGIPPEPAGKKHWRIPSDVFDRVMAMQAETESLVSASRRLGVSRGTLALRLRAMGAVSLRGRVWRLPPAVFDAAAARGKRQ